MVVGAAGAAGSAGFLCRALMVLMTTNSTKATIRKLMMAVIEGEDAKGFATYPFS